MRALKEHKTLELTGMPEPAAGPDEVLVRVKASASAEAMSMDAMGVRDAHSARGDGARSVRRRGSYRQSGNPVPGWGSRHIRFDRLKYAAVPERIVDAVPDAITFEQAAMIVAVSVGVHAAALTPVKLGDSAVVVGAGMIGLLVIQALRPGGVRSNHRGRCERIAAEPRRGIGSRSLPERCRI